MNTFIFIICVSFIFFLPGIISYSDRKQVVFTNGSTLTVLTCSIPNAKEAVWKFKPASGDEKKEICKMHEGNEQCNSTQFPNIKLADPDGFRKVSATPENPICEGATVQLMLESSDISYFRNMTWSVSTNKIKGEGIEIYWKLNKEKIVNNSRFQFDYRSLNISGFRSEDQGRYVYTVKCSKGNSSFYSISLQIAGATTSQTNTSLSTTGTTASQTNTSLSTTGTTASQTNTSLLTTGIWIAAFLFGTLGIMIIIILLCIIIKKKCTSAGDPDTVQAATVDNEVPYATINLAASNKAEPSAPVTTENTLYAQVKRERAEPATNEISV
ncbi:uncharacterized protein LOC134350250 isoform X2 [Mobula hypostoma]|uniref:uncharacterized protein LOC134350250 isoform X2 n=1 Tax=Mobula hypostoma TaxID=723540 RepID=UPI002FC2FE6C